MTPNQAIAVEGRVCELVVSAIAGDEPRRHLFLGLDVHRVWPMGNIEPAEGWRRLLLPDGGPIGYFAGALELAQPGLRVGMRVCAVCVQAHGNWEMRSIAIIRDPEATTLPKVRQVSQTAPVRRTPTPYGMLAHAGTGNRPVARRTTTDPI